MYKGAGLKSKKMRQRGNVLDSGVNPQKILSLFFFKIFVDQLK